MTKKQSVLLATSFLAVAAFYFFLYRDSFRGHHIQIVHTFRASERALLKQNGGDEPLRNVVFGLERKYKLTSVKVVPVAEYEKNKFAHPVWELVSDSNSIPTRVFTYGVAIRGMHPAQKGAKPEQLDLNVPYRLIVEAEGINGIHDFTLGEEDHVK